MQVCTSLQTDNHTSTPPLVFYRPDALPAPHHARKAQMRNNCKRRPVKTEVFKNTYNWDIGGILLLAVVEYSS